MPGDGQPSSGYLVTADGVRLLLDCGPGVATALSAHPEADDLSAVLVSHLHLDHCYDLLPLGKMLLARGLRRAGLGPIGTLGDALPSLPRVPLFVPVGGAAILARLATLFPVRSTPVLDRAFELAFDVREYRPGDTVHIGPTTVTFHELRHIVTNCGIRIETAGAVLAYTGDTGVTDRLVPLATGADLLLAEATMAETDPGPHGHLAASDAGRVAAEAGVRRLVLTHFSQTDDRWLAECRAGAAEQFAGPVEVALPGRRFRVEPTS
jgi:ribonuclease BN (tRNA processing enzyme)